MLAYVFEKFRSKGIEIYELDSATHFLSAAGLAWQVCLKNTRVKEELLTDVYMIFVIEKRIRGGICHAINKYAKANNKYTKNYEKDFKSLYHIYLDANNLYGWAMSQKLPVNGLNGKKIYLNLIHTS